MSKPTCGAKATIPRPPQHHQTSKGGKSSPPANLWGVDWKTVLATKAPQLLRTMVQHWWQLCLIIGTAGGMVAFLLYLWKHLR